jgi:hypothetical protein
VETSARKFIEKNQTSERWKILKEVHQARTFARGVTIPSSTKTSSAIGRVYYLRGVSACDRKFCFALPRRRADT